MSLTLMQYQLKEWPLLWRFVQLGISTDFLWSNRRFQYAEKCFNTYDINIWHMHVSSNSKKMWFLIVFYTSIFAWQNHYGLLHFFSFLTLLPRQQLFVSMKNFNDILKIWKKINFVFHGNILKVLNLYMQFRFFFFI